MSTILVLGGAGYVGSHCCKMLAARGFTPVVYDNLSTGHPEFVRWGRLITGDIRDRVRLSRTIEETKPAAVVHFAALALVRRSVFEPGPYFDNNVGGTLALLECMRDHGPRNLVFSSSCAVYGEVGELPISEQAPCRPINPYGASKLACEWMMDSFDKAHGIRSVRLRYFNAAGADRDSEIGELHDPETHLVPLCIEAALGRRPAVQVFGTDFQTTDGTAIRDYVHVVDLATAHIAALNYLLDGGQTQSINLGAGQGVSVSSIIDQVEAVAGRRVEREIMPRQQGDPAALVADPRRAAMILGWNASYQVSDIIRDAWEWHRRRNDPQVRKNA